MPPTKAHLGKSLLPKPYLQRCLLPARQDPSGAGTPGEWPWEGGRQSVSSVVTAVTANQVSSSTQHRCGLPVGGSLVWGSIIQPPKSAPRKRENLLLSPGDFSIKLTQVPVPQGYEVPGRAALKVKLFFCYFVTSVCSKALGPTLLE